PALQHQLPALLKACDELVLNAFAPVPLEDAPSEDPHAQEDVLEALSDVESPETFVAASCPPAQIFPLAPSIDAPRLQATPELVPCEPSDAYAWGDVPGTDLGNRSDCRTRWDALTPEGGLQPEPPSAGSRGQVEGAVCTGDASLHSTESPPPLALGPVDCASDSSSVHPQGQPAS
ncbi:MAG: hypothetical protein EOO70_04195, partial [Myxococcaceae bacterium]